MTNDFRTLIETMAIKLDVMTQMLKDDRSLTDPLADRARAALAKTETGPSDEELLELAEQYRSDGLIDLYSARDFARAVLARFGSAPRPIPVAGDVSKEDGDG